MRRSGLIEESRASKTQNGDRTGSRSERSGTKVLARGDFGTSLLRGHNVLLGSALDGPLANLANNELAKGMH